MYSMYFSDIMAISQSYNKGNHKPHNTGVTLKDYPIDETYGVNNGTFLAPFDLEVVKKYKATSNQIWVTSLEKVIIPSSSVRQYVTILIGHISDEEIDKICVGDKYSQGEVVVHEYKDKLSTGPHNHVTAGIGKIHQAGWGKNEAGVWCLKTTLGTRKPEDIFYINKNMKIVNNGGLKWKYLPEVTKKYYVTLDDLYVCRTTNVGFYKRVSECTTALKPALKYSKPTAWAVIKKGTTITALDIIDTKDGYLWIKNYSGYICLKGVSGRYYLSEVK